MITPLNFPKANLKLKKKDGEVYVWCILRKKDLVCTPEEWVRQHTIHYLINQKNIPEGLIASEYAIKYNGRSKRADIVVFDRTQKPVLIVECKAPEIKLTKETLFQIAQYNKELDVDFLFLTNGLDHFIVKVNKVGMEELDEIPNFIMG